MQLIELFCSLNFRSSRPSARFLLTVPLQPLNRLLFRLVNCLSGSLVSGHVSTYEAEEILFNTDCLMCCCQMGVDPLILAAINVGTQLTAFCDLVNEETASIVIDRTSKAWEQRPPSEEDQTENWFVFERACFPSCPRLDS